VNLKWFSKNIKAVFAEEEEEEEEEGGKKATPKQQLVQRKKIPYGYHVFPGLLIVCCEG
jgi:hypothetical protein